MRARTERDHPSAKLKMREGREKVTVVEVDTEVAGMEYIEEDMMEGSEVVVGCCFTFLARLLVEVADETGGWENVKLDSWGEEEEIGGITSEGQQLTTADKDPLVTGGRNWMRGG